MWRGTQLKEIYIAKIKIHLADIRLLIDTLDTENEEAESLKLVFRTELNRNQSKFGLAGIARNAVTTHIANNPSAAIGLSAFHTAILNEEPKFSEKFDGGSRRGGGSSKTKKRRRGKFPL